MKKLILCLSVMAFAVAVQAGEGKACKDKAACADTAKAQAKAECGATAASCSAGKTVAKKVLMSPKALSLASK